ncbi:MAG: hypothetical protein AAF960_25125 [Bacteroidota bacterium]
MSIFDLDMKRNGMDKQFIPPTHFYQDKVASIFIDGEVCFVALPSGNPLVWITPKIGEYFSYASG